MKNKSSFKKQFLILTLGVLMFSFAACDKDKDQPQAPVETTKKAALSFSGAREVPAITTNGTGSGQLSYDIKSKTISFAVTWKLGDPAATTTDMHFHGAEDGSDTKSSPVVVELEGFSTGNSGTFSTKTRALTASEEAQLLAGKWYMNIHSTTDPKGEIRANIKF